MKKFYCTAYKTNITFNIQRVTFLPHYFFIKATGKGAALFMIRDFLVNLECRLFLSGNIEKRRIIFELQSVISKKRKFFAN